MPRSLLAPLLVGALVLAPLPAAACSLAPPWSSGTWSPGRVTFIGAPVSDTLFAGAGATRLGVGPGHLGPTPDGRSVHGQVVHVGRLAPNAEPALVEAVRRAGGRVVLVPWDYAADCSPRPWGRSYRWLADSARGLFVGTLRDTAHWAGGMPTIDVTPAFIPYDGRVKRRAGARPTDGGLTPDELLDLVATLPSHEEVSARLDTAYEPLRRWIAAHPELSKREPASWIVRSMGFTLAGYHVRRRTVPLAGTWRVTVEMPPDSTAPSITSTFFVRTSDRPYSAVGDVRAPVGVYLIACAHADEATLAAMPDRQECQRRTDISTEGYVAVGDSTWTTTDGRLMRPGSIDVLVGAAALRARHQKLAMERIRSTDDRDPRRFLPGTFTEWPDGRVTFVMEPMAGDTPGIRIIAERVSGHTMPSNRERR